MEECKICFYDTPADEFYHLACCGNNNRICKACIELLTVPLCPFCRTRIQGLSEKPTFRGAISLDVWTPPTGLFYLNPMDDTFLDSRILRRQMKRLRKLQEREREAENNRRLTMVLQQSKRRQEQLKRQEIQRTIREDTDIFTMDEEEEGDRSEEEK